MGMTAPHVTYPDTFFSEKATYFCTHCKLDGLAPGFTDGDDMAILPCTQSNRHVDDKGRKLALCKAFMKTYLKDKIRNSSGDVKHINCSPPYDGSPAQTKFCHPVTLIDVQRYASPEDADMFERFQRAQYLKDFQQECGAASGVVFVQCPKCDKSWNFWGDANKNVATCWEGCQHVFCRLCQKPWTTDAVTHADQDCDAYEKARQEQLDPANLEALSMALIASNSKPCPECKVNTEKNGGCDHITCQNVQANCTHEWCWVCLRAWDSIDGYHHWNADHLQNNGCTGGY